MAQVRTAGQIRQFLHVFFYKISLEVEAMLKKILDTSNKKNFEQFKKIIRLCITNCPFYYRYT